MLPHPHSPLCCPSPHERDVVVSVIVWVPLPLGWLNLDNAELSVKRYGPGPRSQEVVVVVVVGEEGDYT